MILDINGIKVKPGNRVKINHLFYDVYLDIDTKILMIKQICPSYDKPHVAYLHDYKDSFEIIK